MVRAVTAHTPYTVICDGSSDIRKITRDISCEVTFAIVSPQRGTIVVSTSDGEVVTFDCASSRMHEGSQALRMTDALIGLGLSSTASEVAEKYGHLINPTAPSHEQHILEKPTIGQGIAHRPIRN